MPTNLTLVNLSTIMSIAINLISSNINISWWFAKNYMQIHYLHINIVQSQKPPQKYDTGASLSSCKHLYVYSFTVFRYSKNHIHPWLLMSFDEMGNLLLGTNRQYRCSNQFKLDERTFVFNTCHMLYIRFCLVLMLFIIGACFDQCVKFPTLQVILIFVFIG